MIHLSKKFVVGFSVFTILITVVLNSSAQKIPFSTSKTNRTLIKDIIVAQREMRADQKEMLKLLRDIQKSVNKISQ